MGSAGEIGDPAVVEAAGPGILARLDINDGPLDRLIGNENARLFSGGQGDNLHYGDGNILVVGAAVGLITPAPRFGLILEDDLDSLFEGLANFIAAAAFAPDFRQGQGGQAVLVHVDAEIAVVGPRRGEKVPEPLGHHLAVRFVVGEIALDHVRHQAQTR